MTAKGVMLQFEQTVSAIIQTEQGLQLTLSNGARIETDCVLFATGRRPRTANLGLDTVGVALDAGGYIEVNSFFQTNVPNIYAIGDVIGGAELTPVALAQGMAVAKTLFRGEATALDHQLIPTAVFSQPNFAAVGLSEEDAREHYGDIAVFTSKFTQLKHTLAGNTEKTLMKLVVDQATDRVVGAHMVGSDAGEIIQGLAVAMRAGATKADFDNTLGIHPTAAEEFVTMRSRVR
jgi:glutathione reductase (NADPH)